MPPTNPYQPPSSAIVDHIFDGTFRFDGIIERADYLLFFNISAGERLVWLVLSLVALIGGIPICLIALISQIRSGQFDGVPIVLLFLVLACTAFYYTFQKLLGRRAAEQKLATYPDLLGIARGELNADGLWFNDGVHQHWFSPVFLRNSSVSLLGIRVPLDTDPARYLALTTRIFLSFDANAAYRLIRSWRSVQFVDQPELMNQRLGEAPPGAIHFRFSTPITILANASSNVGIMIVNTMLQLVLLGLSMLLWESIGKWMALGVLISWSIAVIAWAIRLHQRYRQARRPTSLTQVGWLSDTEFATYSSLYAVRTPLDDSTLVLVADDQVVVHLRSASFPVARQSLVDPSQWDRLIKKFRRNEIESS